jgi:hypothetical protein
MNRRLGLPLVAVLALGAAPALAAPKAAPSCLLVTDDPGDASPGAGPSSDAVDIISGDLGSGAKNLVVVLRLKSFATDTVTTTGATYVFAWTAGSTPQSVQLLQYSDGTRAASFKPDNSFGSNVPAIPVAFAIDAANATITWSIPRRVVPELKKKGVKFSALDVSARPATNTNLPTGSSSITALNGDAASSPRTYVDSTATCVKGV